MLEMPIAPSLTDDEVASFNRVLVHSGLPIKTMNTLRKHISAIKGGRLAVLAGQSTHCTLLISDVPPGNAGCSWLWTYVARSKYPRIVPRNS